MKSKLNNSLRLCCLVIALSVTVLSQSPAGNAGQSPMTFVGESLTYEGKISRMLMTMTLADLKFTAVQGNSSGDLLIQTEATSRGTLFKLFRYSFLQKYESTIDGQFRIVRTTKHDVQKERVRDSDAIFDYEQHRVTYVETDPKDPNRPPRRIASEIGATMQDIVSAIYYLRTQPLSVGKRLDIEISDSGLVYKVPVSVTLREQLKTALGRINCFRVEPQVYGPGRLIEQNGKMMIWFADDAKHTPVRAVIDSQYGKIEVKLKASGK